MDGSDRATTVLTIEDDRTQLDDEGYAVREAATGRQGPRRVFETRPDIVILDVGLPDLDGWEVLERIRDMSDAPVLCVLDRVTEHDEVQGHDAGADAFFTKPVSRSELRTRLDALGGRPASGRLAPAPFDDGRLRFDFLLQQACLHGSQVLLTPIEYRLLSALVRHAGRTLSADQLIELAWEDPSG